MSSKSSYAFAAISLAAWLAACNQTTPAQSVAKDAPSQPAAMASMPGMQGGQASTGKPAAEMTATSTGVITALDPATGRVTLKHGPIPEIKWPAMTMAFPDDPPTLLNGLKVGEPVRFTLTGKGQNYRVTAITSSARPPAQNREDGA